MIGTIFSAIIYNPLYNALIYLIDTLPGHDAGLAVIVLTILVRLLLYPLARRAISSQIAMKAIVPEVEEIKKKYKGEQAKQGQEIMKLYRDRGVRPFAGIGLVIVQIPILIGLFFIFSRGGLPHVNTSILYSFIPSPVSINMIFLGIFNMGANHNIILAGIVLITQIISTRLSMGPRRGKDAIEESLSADMARSFDLQARYVFPFIIAFVGFSVTSAATLYYVINNVFMIAQEYLAGRRFNT